MSDKRRAGYLGKPEAELTPSDVARFWAKVQRMSPDECWPWLASLAARKRSRGYGQFGIECAGRRVNLLAHRVAYTLSRGPIPDGAAVLHACDNSVCVNPAHLSAGDQRRNIQDAVARGRFHVPRPSRHVITDAQCDEIVALVRSGALQYRVAERFGVSATFVSLLVKGRRRQYRAPQFQGEAVA